METCRKCGSLVDEVLRVKTGHACKKCVSEYNRVYREANKERIAESKALWKIKNAEHVKIRDRQYALANPDKKAAARNKWKSANPELERAARKAWEARNPEKVKSCRIAYTKANKGAVQARCIKRRASKKYRTPEWLTPAHYAEIEGVYIYCQIFNQYISDKDDKLEIDHIIPLQGDLVSGLHVPWNLQALTARQNRIKSNKFEVENA